MRFKSASILLRLLFCLVTATWAASSVYAQQTCLNATNSCFVTNLLAPGCNNPECCGSVCTIEPACCDVAWDDLCVALARKVCSLCGSVPESCFEAHPSPACNNGLICSAVCDVVGFEYCCAEAWDQACVQQAILLTGNCGDAPAGSCLIPHENPNCADAACCTQVCTIDPHCCEVTWDAPCVQWADRYCFSCGNPRAGSCCHQNQSPYCDDRVCCEQICVIDGFCCETRWDSVCGEAATELCAQCSRICGYTDPLNPAARQCRLVHVQPGCSDAACCDEVCYFDAFCCAVSWDFTCVEAARAICALSPNQEVNLICSTAIGSCFVPHKGPGCSDAACCASVCSSDPLCCDPDVSQWDQSCAQRAAIVCNGCGDIRSGSCFTPHGSPSCLDRQCCNDVCDLDPTCCASEWDILCVLTAGTICVDTGIACGDPRTRPCSVPSYLPACEDQNCCLTICGIDPTCCSRAWDETCAATAGVGCAAASGCPGPGSPLVVHAQGGCSDLECCSAVCSVDPTCCSFGWNERCVTIAKSICWSFGDCPGEEPCSSPHPTPGCSDATCCSVVCDFDPLCCEVQWNSPCVSAARSLCTPRDGWICPCAGSCFEAHPSNAGCQDEVCCSGVCNVDPSCCTVSWDLGCASLAKLICCGLPGCGDPCAGDCLQPHTRPNCEDPACCEAVCRFEPFCCEVRWDSSCVLAARETCDGGCGQVVSGNCFDLHDTPGCAIGDCCEQVCADEAFEYCCQVRWDQACVNRARVVCSEYMPDCGDVGLDGCNKVHETPACSDSSCCTAVCAVDPFCCSTAWDSSCVERSYSTLGCERYQYGCGDKCAGSCCEPHDAPWCQDQTCCQAICLIDIFCCTSQWDQFCADAARLNTACEPACPDPECGTQEAGDCCFPHGNANCNDLQCCVAVCAVDSTCCETVWDQICASIAATECKQCASGVSCGDPRAGSCCNEHPQPYCNDAKCCNVVCSFNPPCCDLEWDTVCVQIAQALCGCGQ